MQMGGLGVTAVGAGLILLVGKKMDLKGRNVVREAMNLDSGKGVVRFIRNVFFTTVIIELIGAILSFPVFVQDYSVPRAIGISIFHSVAAFNNSGFDILGGMQSLTGYNANVFLNIVTCVLIFLGGIGFLVIREVISKKFRWKKFSMHARVVLSVSAALLVAGTLMLKLTESDKISWLGAFFSSCSARTAGFSTYSFGGFSNAGIIVMIFLMIVGASPGSTGGGIKTSTFFVLLQGIKSAATNRSEKAFHYSIPKEAFKKAAVIILLALAIITVSSFLIAAFEPEIGIRDILFEMTSAFATVGLSTGITPTLSVGAKIVSCVVMYIGRLGPLTIASVWYFSRGERVSYPEGNIAIG
jgi:trk system potassium uptake protein TrkH